ncbi:MAG: helix-turn-helix domain-containing protein [Xenococcaceae cyanobacterium]
MPQTKIQGKFYPLQHEEFIKLNKHLTQSELAVYLWLKTNDPFGERLVEADTKEIAKDLNVSRRTIQRALVKLREQKLIDLVITKFHYRIRSKSASDNSGATLRRKTAQRNAHQESSTNEVKERLRVATSVSPGDTDVAETISMSPKCHPCRQSAPHVAEVTPMSRSSSESPPSQEFQNPKTIKTNKKLQTNQTVDEKTFFQEDERPRVGERRKGMREEEQPEKKVVQDRVQDEESKKEKKLVSVAETKIEIPRDVAQEKFKIERTKVCTNEQKKKVARSPEIPEDLKEKLLELEIPLDSKVISAIRRSLALRDRISSYFTGLWCSSPCREYLEHNN